MEINTINGLIRVGEILLGNKKYDGKNYVSYEYSLVINYDENLPKKLKTKKLSIVYLFCINGIIYKIGQSTSEKGISSCINFYLKSGQDDCGFNRFTINSLMRDEINKGNKIEVYMKYNDLIETKIPGLFKDEIGYTALSAKAMEQVCLKQYFEKEGKYPKWNFQENN